MAPCSRPILAVLLSCIGVAVSQGTNVPFAVPEDAGVKLPPGFIAFSIEFAGLPPFAGGKPNANIYTQNLMISLGEFTGVPPYIRSGGNTQDEIYFDQNLDIAILWTDGMKFNRFTIGPAYFDSLNNWPNGTKLSYGFNLKNTSAGAQQNLADTAKAACKGINMDSLAFWEMGNEPDLYAAGRFNHDIRQYVRAWQAGVKTVQDAISQECPGVSVPYMGPSFSGPVGAFKETAAFAAGLDSGKLIRITSSHNYISGAHSPGITLQNTLMNHQTTTKSVKAQTNLLKAIAPLAPNAPFILGEANSLFGGGAAGVSNVFGAAIWVVDFSLRCASQSIQRVHFHQSEGAPYSAWNPRRNVAGEPTTYPPYYGNVAVAAFLGKDAGVQVVDFPQPSPYQAVYGAYAGGVLKRMAVLNMNTFNSTQQGVRPSVDFRISLGGSYASFATVRRLQAEGSDVTSGVTFNGYSFDYAAGHGKPVNVGHLPPEIVNITGGAFTITIPSSEVAILQF